MPRATLQPQSQYEYKFQTTIETQHLNYAGHLGNDSLISLIHEARINIFQELGCKELDLGDGKTGIIIGDLVVNFKAEGFVGEDLQIESHVDEVTDKSLRLYHRVSKVKDRKLIALVETGLVAFDYKKREITNLPEEFIQALK